MSAAIKQLNKDGLVSASGLPLSKSKPKTAETFIGTPSLSDFVWICHHLPEDEKDQFLALSGEDEYDGDEAAMGAFSLGGPKWVLIQKDGGMPLACGGYTRLRPEVWQSFMLVPEASWESHGLAITWYVLKILKEMKNQGHRLQTLVLSERAKARAWYARIGLQNEGTLRHYGANGENFEMYSIVQEQEND